MYKSATNVPNDAKWGIMPNVLNTDPILSAPNATGVPNVNTAQNVPKMTNPSVPKNHLMYQLTLCTNRCTKWTHPPHA